MKRIRNITLYVPGTQEELKSQTILHQGEPTKYDADGVVAGKFHTVTTRQDGDKLFTVDEYPITALILIRTLIDNVQYSTRADIKIADKIFNKLPINWKEKQPEHIDLEDAEFEFVKRNAETYPPYLAGRKFSPFLSELEEATDVPLS